LVEPVDIVGDTVVAPYQVLAYPPNG